MVVPSEGDPVLPHSVLVTLVNRDGTDSPHCFRFKKPAELVFGRFVIFFSLLMFHQILFLFSLINKFSGAECDFIINRKGVQPNHCKLIIDKADVCYFIHFI